MACRAAATRLAYVTEGDEQVKAALRVGDASQKAGRPGDSVPVLELVHQQQPGIEIIRDKLREMYEAAGEFRQLAGILIADADHGSDPALRYTNYRAPPSCSCTSSRTPRARRCRRRRRSSSSPTITAR